MLLIDVFLFHSYPLLTLVLSLASDRNKLRVQILVTCVTLRNNCSVLCTNNRNTVIVGIMFQLSFGQAKTSKVLIITIVTLPSILFSFSCMKQLYFSENMSLQTDVMSAIVPGGFWKRALEEECRV